MRYDDTGDSFKFTFGDDTSNEESGEMFIFGEDNEPAEETGFYEIGDSVRFENTLTGDNITEEDTRGNGGYIPLGSPRGYTKKIRTSVDEGGGSSGKVAKQETKRKKEIDKEKEHSKGGNRRNGRKFRVTKEGMVVGAIFVVSVMLLSFAVFRLIPWGEQSEGEQIINAGAVPIEDTLVAAEAVSKEEFASILENTGYTSEDVESLLSETDEVNWSENAYRRLKLYLDNVGISEKVARESMAELGFSDEEIEYAISGVEDIDWNEQAVKRGDAYLQLHVVTEDNMLKALVVDGFTKEQAEYAVRVLPCDEMDE